VPLCLDTKDPEKIIETVRLIAPSFGAINLEDISQPKCFYILDELRKDCKIPVWHDDQQGTAAINLAGLYSALKIVRKKIEEIRVGFFWGWCCLYCDCKDTYKCRSKTRKHNNGR
jgi:malate dehydrogenase (oxaloacetate-decarboxylating)